MSWEVGLHGDFGVEFDKLSEVVQDELLVQMKLLEKFGPQLSRPHADTLNGSKDPKMKELRFKANGGVWRVAFAFDTERKAILLAVIDKSGRSETRAYRQLIAKADKRFDSYLAELKKKGNK